MTKFSMGLKLSNLILKKTLRGIRVWHCSTCVFVPRTIVLANSVPAVHRNNVLLLFRRVNVLSYQNYGTVENSARVRGGPVAAIASYSSTVLVQLTKVALEGASHSSIEGS